MKENNHHFIINFIIVTIVTTIAIQVYWNIRNYASNKQQLISEVQTALDNAVELYYADLAKTDMVTFVNKGTTVDSVHNIFGLGKAVNVAGGNARFFTWDSLSKKINFDTEFFSREDTLHVKQKIDLSNLDRIAQRFKPSQIQGESVTGDTIVNNSLDTSSIRSLTNKIIISITRDSIAFDTLVKNIDNELKRKDINLLYALGHYNKDLVLLGSFNDLEHPKLKLSAFSKSTYLPRGEQLKIVFSNVSLITLKRGLTGILLSFILAAGIMACLLYLLRIINKQKQLAEIKNDLISNITHEFKTPITTVSTALEGIEKFNDANDKEKTQKYLNISNKQLEKLHFMVERLLETATLDSDKLLLNKEPLNMVRMLQNLTDRHIMISPEKHISFISHIETCVVKADHFHLENAVSNIIDNAVKYGGDTIEIRLNSVPDFFEITVANNGPVIEKGYREKIFDKFYRIPSGNRHDVKGFGIGLYYTKKIIEKHGGSIQLLSDPRYTIFKIQLLHETTH
ncbi:HAMP domain-containing sensor histidine kinase [Ascidiimonas aurantiaca]|uniref:sensor histidine kinase n=1 Tax=Ascidiimonas aurantiaca TaxID=1685432 RepID=UPI0030EC19F7